MTGPAAFWWRWMLTTAVIFGLAWLLLTGLDTGPRPGRLLLLVTVGMAVLALVNVSVVSDGPDWTVDTVASVSPPGQDARLGMYTRVIGNHLDSRELDPALRDRLADLADRRLRLRHGVALRSPGAADLLGAEVTGILTGPVRRLSRIEIDRCVKRIEEI